MSTTLANAASRPWQRFLRFSVRGLIVLVLVIGGWLGWFIHRVELQHAAVESIDKGGGFVTYEWDWKDGASNRWRRLSCALCPRVRTFWMSRLAAAGAMVWRPIQLPPAMRPILRLVTALLATLPLLTALAPVAEAPVLPPQPLWVGDGGKPPARKR